MPWLGTCADGRRSRPRARARPARHRQPARQRARRPPSCWRAARGGGTLGRPPRARRPGAPSLVARWPGTDAERSGTVHDRPPRHGAARRRTVERRPVRRAARRAAVRARVERHEGRRGGDRASPPSASRRSGAARPGLELVLTRRRGDRLRGRARTLAGDGALGRAGAVLVAEPTGGVPHVAHKGVLWARGDAPRASPRTARRRTSAATRSTRWPRAVAALARRSRFDVPPHPLLGEPTLNVGTIAGGVERRTSSRTAPRR